MRLPIRRALALDAPESISRPFFIGNAKAGTIVVAEIKLRQIALQMGFADVVINASDVA